MKPQTQNSKSISSKYILVKKNEKIYRLFLKDLKSIKVRVKKDRPRVPEFD